jgi:hypothetical protein
VCTTVGTDTRVYSSYVCAPSPVYDLTATKVLNHSRNEPRAPVRVVTEKRGVWTAAPDSHA